MTTETTSSLTTGEAALYDKVAKLLALASKNPSAEEAASAAAKAQELIDRYNLDVAQIEKAGGAKEGKRENAAVNGGFYLHERTLYHALAELHFCHYWCEDYWADRPDRKKRAMAKEMGVGFEHWKDATRKKKKSRHRLVGKIINTMACRHMATYLRDSVERLLADKLRKSNGEVDQTQFLSRWAMSFREGATENLVSRIREMRATNERARQAEARRRAAATGKGSSATTLTIADVARTEEAANYDFMHGEGAWQELQDWRVQSAKEAKEERERMAKLAKDNPEEFARIEKERLKEARGGRGSRGGGYRDKPRDYGAYDAGHDAADKISLSQQVGDAPTARIRGR